MQNYLAVFQKRFSLSRIATAFANNAQQDLLELIKQLIKQNFNFKYYLNYCLSCKYKILGLQYGEVLNNYYAIMKDFFQK